MDTLKNVFCAAALAFGGAGLVFGGLGLATGGFSSGPEMGGVDLTPVGCVITAASGVLFAAGWCGARSGNKPSDPKP